MADIKIPNISGADAASEVRDLSDIIQGSPFFDPDKLNKWLTSDFEKSVANSIDSIWMNYDLEKRLDNMQTSLDIIANMSIAITSAIYTQKLKEDTKFNDLNFANVDLSKSPFRPQEVINIIKGETKGKTAFDYLEFGIVNAIGALGDILSNPAPVFDEKKFTSILDKFNTTLHNINTKLEYFIDELDKHYKNNDNEKNIDDINSSISNIEKLVKTISESKTEKNDISTSISNIEKLVKTISEAKNEKNDINSSISNIEQLAKAISESKTENSDISTSISNIEKLVKAISESKNEKNDINSSISNIEQLVKAISDTINTTLQNIDSNLENIFKNLNTHFSNNNIEKNINDISASILNIEKLIKNISGSKDNKDKKSKLTIIFDIDKASIKDLQEFLDKNKDAFAKNKGGEGRDLISSLLDSLASLSRFDRKSYKQTVKNLRKISKLFERPNKLTKLGLSNKGLIYQILQNISEATLNAQGDGSKDAKMFAATFKGILDLMNVDKDSIKQLKRNLRSILKVLNPDRSVKYPTYFMFLDRVKQVAEEIKGFGDRKEDLATLNRFIGTSVDSLVDIKDDLKDASKSIKKYKEYLTEFNELVTEYIIKGLNISKATRERLNDQNKVLYNVITGYVNIFDGVGIADLFLSKISIRLMIKSAINLIEFIDIISKIKGKDIENSINNINAIDSLIMNVENVLLNIKDITSDLISYIAIGKLSNKGLNQLVTLSEGLNNLINTLNILNITDDTIDKVRKAKLLMTNLNELFAGEINNLEINNQTISDIENLVIFSLYINDLVKAFDKVKINEKINQKVTLVSDFIDRVSLIKFDRFSAIGAGEKLIIKGISSVITIINHIDKLKKKLDKFDIPDETFEKIQKISSTLVAIGDIPFGRIVLAGLLALPAIPALWAIGFALSKGIPKIIRAINKLPDPKDAEDKLKNIKKLVYGVTGMMAVAGLAGIVLLPLTPTLMAFVGLFKLFVFAVVENIVECAKEVKDTAKDINAIKNLVIACAGVMMIGALFMMIPDAFMLALKFTGTLALFLIGVMTAISVGLLLMNKISGGTDPLKEAENMGTLVAILAGVMMIGALFMMIPDAFMLALKFTGTLALFLIGVMGALAFGVFLIDKAGGSGSDFDDAISIGKLVAILGGVMLIGAAFMYIDGMAENALKFIGLMALFLIATVGIIALASAIADEKTIGEVRKLGWIVLLLSAVVLGAAAIIMNYPELIMSALIFTGLMALFIVATVGILSLLTNVIEEKTVGKLWQLSLIVMLLGGVMLFAGWLITSGIITPIALFTFVGAALLLVGGLSLAVWLLGGIKEEELKAGLNAIKWITLCVIGLGIAMIAMGFAYQLAGGEEGILGLLGFVGVTILLLAAMGGLVWWMGSLDEDVLERGLNATKWITLCIIGIGIAMIAMGGAYQIAGGEKGVLGLLAFIGVTILLMAAMGGLVWWMGSLDEDVLERGVDAAKWITLCVIGFGIAMIAMAFAYSLLEGMDIWGLYGFVGVGILTLIVFGVAVWCFGTQMEEEELRRGLIALGILEAAVGLFGFCLWPLANTYQSLNMGDADMAKFLGFTQIGALVLAELGAGMVILGKVYDKGMKEMLAGAAALAILEGLVALFGLCLQPLVHAFEPVMNTDMAKFLGFTQTGMLVLAELAAGTVLIGTAVFGPQALLWLAGGAALVVLEGLVALFGLCLEPLVNSFTKLGGADVNKFFEFTQVGMKVLVDVAVNVVAMGAAVFGPQALVFAAGIKAMDSTAEAARKIGIALQEVGKAAEVLNSIKKFDAKNAIELCKEAKNLVEALEPLGEPNLALIITRASVTVTALSMAISIIGKSIQEVAKLQVPIYDGPDIVGYRSLTTEDFKDAAENTKTIITTLGNAIIDVYKNAPDGMFNRDGKFADIGMGDTPFDRVVKGCTGLGSMIGSIAQGIKDYAELRINTYDKNGKVNGSREMKFEDFQEAAKNIGIIVTTLGDAVAGIYAKDPKMFDNAMILTEMESSGGLTGISKNAKFQQDDNPFTKVIKACSGLGTMISAIANGVRDFSELRINEYNPDGSIKSVTKMGDTEFEAAGKNIEKVLGFLCPAVANVYKDPEMKNMFDQAMVLVSHTDGGWFGDDVDQFEAQDSPFTKVVKACSGLGMMIGGIADGIMTFADGKIAIYKEGTTEISHYEKLENHYDNAQKQIKNVLTFLCKTLAQIYEEHKEDLFKSFEGEDSVGSKIVNTITQASSIIGQIGKAIGDFVGGKIPTGYDKEGKVTGYMVIGEIKPEEIQNQIIPLANLLPELIFTINDKIGNVFEGGNNFSDLIANVRGAAKDIQSIVVSTSDLYRSLLEEGNLIDAQTVQDINAKVSAMFSGGGLMKIIKDSFNSDKEKGGISGLIEGLWSGKGFNEKDIVKSFDNAKAIIIPIAKLYEDVNKSLTNIGTEGDIVKNTELLKLMLNQISSIDIPKDLNVNKKTVEKLHYMRMSIEEVVGIFDYNFENVNTTNVDSITDAINRINAEVSKIENPKHFIAEGKGLNDYVKAINKVDLSKTNAMTELLKAMKENIEVSSSNKVQVLINKLTDIVSALTNELNRTSTTMKQADTIQKRRQEALQKTAESIKHMIASPIEVKVTQEDDGKGSGNSGGGGSSSLATIENMESKNSTNYNTKEMSSLLNKIRRELNMQRENSNKEQ